MRKGAVSTPLTRAGARVCTFCAVSMATATTMGSAPRVSPPMAAGFQPRWHERSASMRSSSWRVSFMEDKSTTLGGAGGAATAVFRARLGQFFQMAEVAGSDIEKGKQGGVVGDVQQEAGGDRAGDGAHRGEDHADHKHDQDGRPGAAQLGGVHYGE